MKQGPNRNARMNRRSAGRTHFDGIGPDPLQFVPLRLRALRESAGITQTDLARIVGTSNATISAYEDTERTDIPLRLLQQICRVYDLSLTRFFADWSVGVPYVDREKVREKLAA